MTDSKETRDSDLGILRKMQIGEVREFPLSKLSNIRSMCSTISLQWGKRLATKTYKDEGVVRVTREK